MTDSQKSQNKQQRRWAVCRAKVKAGAFSAVVDIDSDSESDPDEGFGDDASRPSMLKVRNYVQYTTLSLLLPVSVHFSLPVINGARST